jgi:glycosyltransferase involved in cell wall biosynthesis
MRVYLWNAHWKTLGGGEVYAGVLADILKQDGFKVTILGKTKSPFYELKNRLGIDLTGIDYYRVPLESTISSLVRSNDIFINGSFASRYICPSKKSIYICHFPVPKIGSRKIPNLTHFKSMKLMDVDQNQIYLIDGKGILVGDGRITNNTNFPMTIQCMSGTVIIEGALREKTTLQQGEIRVMTTTDDLNVFSTGDTNSVIQVQLSQKMNQFLNVFRHKIQENKYFPSTYSQVWVNSEFTKKYAMKYWNVETRLVYPPVQRRERISVPKNPYQILSIGRFMNVGAGHSKNQHLLVKAFELLSERSSEPWVLYLLGGVGNDGQQYYNYVSDLARRTNLDIRLMPNCSNEEMETISRSSSFYWHAGGMGVSTSRPQDMEHFGITVVQSMQFECIPVVFDVAGPAEILQEFPQLRFKSLNGLVEKTQRLSNLNSDQRSGITEGLLARFEDFSLDSFKLNVLENVYKLL